MIRVVLDANIYVSALLKPLGLQAQLIRKGIEGVFQPILSRTIFVELCRVLGTKKITDRLPLSRNQVKKILEHLVEVSSWTADEVRVSACEDSDDDIYLACAKEGAADFLVSGDDHLLKMQEWEGIRIVSTRLFLDYLEQNK